MKNKKGLSGIVTTLIIILLVLVSVGVIWQVVGTLLDKSTATIGTSSKCMDVDVRATKVIKEGVTEGIYNVTISRKPTGEGEVGAYIVFFNNIDNSAPIEFGEMLGPLRTLTRTVSTGSPGVINATYVEVTAFFVDEDSGKEMLCPSSVKFEFELA